MLIDEKGWLKEALVYPSPNCNARPPNTKVRLLVIHNISLPPGVWGNDDILALFQNTLDTSRHSYYESLKDLKVSSHFLVDRQGRIYQCVSVLDRAWHAGVSSFEGVDNCNDYSIGIELNGSDHAAFTKDQYKSLAQLTKSLLNYFPELSIQNIVGHSDIAQPPGRKSDPGPYFDWEHYKKLIKEI